MVVQVQRNPVCCWLGREGVRAGNNLGKLLRHFGLAGRVAQTRVLLDEVRGVVAGGLHGPLACSKLEDGFTYDCMLTVVPGVTPQVAARVRAMYPSLAALFAGFREGAESAIADAKPTPESKKRIGPAIAKRLKTLFS